MLQSPGGRKIRFFAPFSPSDWRSLHNMVAALRRISRIETLASEIERELQLRKFSA
jgi:hypothetical protein